VNCLFIRYGWLVVDFTLWYIALKSRLGRVSVPSMSNTMPTSWFGIEDVYRDAERGTKTV